MKEHSSNRSPTSAPKPHDLESAYQLIVDLWSNGAEFWIKKNQLYLTKWLRKL